MSKRTIPELREALMATADDLEGWRSLFRRGEIAAQLRQVAFEMRRRSPSFRKAPTKHKPLTDTEREEITAMKQAYPDMHLSEIAEAFDTNQGRVSEALRGE